jgi:hypothetical protein
VSSQYHHSRANAERDIELGLRLWLGDGTEAQSAVRSLVVERTNCRVVRDMEQQPVRSEQVNRNRLDTFNCGLISDVSVPIQFCTSAPGRVALTKRLFRQLCCSNLVALGLDQLLSPSPPPSFDLAARSTRRALVPLTSLWVASPTRPARPRDTQTQRTTPGTARAL